MNKTKIQIRPRLRVIFGENIALGPGKAELLELLEETGSITKAARKMKMSYMRAWSLIRTMNHCFKAPIVVSKHGGAHGGGGAKLTDDGRQILQLYKKMNDQCLRSVRPAQRQLEKLLCR
jgi:molybdate transport system regulatory protein